MVPLGSAFFQKLLRYYENLRHSTVRGLFSYFPPWGVALVSFPTSSAWSLSCSVFWPRIASCHLYPGCQGVDTGHCPLSSQRRRSTLILTSFSIFETSSMVHWCSSCYSVPDCSCSLFHGCSLPCLLSRAAPGGLKSPPARSISRDLSSHPENSYVSP